MAQGTAINSSVSEELPDAPIEIEGDEPAVEVNGADAVNAAQHAATEARAREMGWKPLAEYRGPPGKWQPAADFISRGENILPIVRDQNRRMTERIGKLEGEVTGLRANATEQLQIIKDLRDMGARASQAGYDRAMAEIKAQQRQAVERGDTASFDQLVERAEALASERPAPAAPVAEPAKPADPSRPQVSPAVRDFVNQNAWFNTDSFLTRKMIDRHVDVIQEGEILEEAAQLTEAKQRLLNDYPDRFGVQPPAREAAPPHPAAPRQPARRAAAVAQPTQEAPTPRPGAAQTTINSIADPAERTEARAAFNRLKRQLPDTTEADWMALYADPHSDILTLQQQKPRRQSDGR